LSPFPFFHADALARWFAGSAFFTGFSGKNSHGSGQLLDLQDHVVIHIIALNACRDWLIELRDESWVIQT